MKTIEALKRMHANSWHDAQGYYQAQGFEPRFIVNIDVDFNKGERWVVSIYDEAYNQDIFSIYLSSREAAELVDEALEQEVIHFDCGYYYQGDDARQTAEADLRADAVATARGWA